MTRGSVATFSQKLDQMAANLLTEVALIVSDPIASLEEAPSLPTFEGWVIPQGRVTHSFFGFSTTGRAYTDTGEHVKPDSSLLYKPPAAPLDEPETIFLEFSEVSDDLFVGEHFDHAAFPSYVCPYLRADAAGRRKRRRGRGRRVGASISGTDRTEVVPGKVLITATTTVAVTSFAIPLNLDSLGARLTTLGNVFQEHRITSMQIVLHPGFSGANRASYAVGYFKVPPLTPPTTIANVYSGAVSRYSDIGDTIPIRLRLSRRVLMNTVRPWFTNNSATGSESLDSTQGVIYVVPAVPASVLTVQLEVAYVCELRGPTLPAVD